MKLRNNAEAVASLEALQECGLLKGYEIEVVYRLYAWYTKIWISWQLTVGGRHTGCPYVIQILVCR